MDSSLRPGCGEYRFLQGKCKRMAQKFLHLQEIESWGLSIQTFESVTCKTGSKAVNDMDDKHHIRNVVEKNVRNGPTIL